MCDAKLFQDEFSVVNWVVLKLNFTIFLIGTVILKYSFKTRV